MGSGIKNIGERMEYLAIYMENFVYWILTHTNTLNSNGQKI